MGFHLRRHRSRNALLGFTEKIRSGHYTAMGAASGMVAGLVAITPAADVVSPLWAIVMGAIAGVLTCLACGLKFKFGYDDSLDVVGVHGVGGFTGTILVGFFGEGTGLLAGGDWRQLVVQLVIALVAILYSAVITASSPSLWRRPLVGASPRPRKSAVSTLPTRANVLTILLVPPAPSSRR